MDLRIYKKCLNDIDPNKIKYLREVILESDDIIILGNGGSNAISSHIAQDYTKVLKKNAISFSDSSKMSCYANDYGWENAYKKFLEDIPNSERNILVILISSSGNSKNILNAAEYSKNKFNLITLSGFSKDNELRKNYGNESIIHFWVDSNDYGIVESIHELILHSIL